MDNRDQILANIRKGRSSVKDQTKGPLFTEKSKKELLERWEDIKKQRAGHKDELLHSFKTECEPLLVKVYEAQTSDEACKFLSSIIKETGASQIITWDSLPLKQLNIDRLLDSLGVQNIASEKEASLTKADRKGHTTLASQAELGVSGADYGLADTGTLVLRALPGQDRSSSLLPPIHVAVLESGNILSSLEDLMVRLQLDRQDRGNLDSCVTLISGPSKTADIEMNLVLGIHGPQDLHVIILK
ncbi:MAG: lactate utilization protein [Desulfatiglandales bacterium]